MQNAQAKLMFIRGLLVSDPHQGWVKARDLAVVGIGRESGGFVLLGLHYLGLVMTYLKEGLQRRPCTETGSICASLLMCASCLIA